MTSSRTDIKMYRKLQI